MDSERITILAVDDNKDNLISLKALINETFPSALVLMATGGEMGLAMAAARDPDVILLDIVMPEMDGFEVCRRLKADKKLSDTPVVFVTAIKGDRESRILALECGAEAFLAKPIDEYELIAQIRAMVKIRTANIEKRDEKQHLATLVAKRTMQLEQELAERKRAEKIQQALYNISNAVVTTNDIEELIRIIGEELGKLVDTTNFYIAFYDEVTGMISSPYVKDEKDDLSSWPAAKSMTGRVVLQDRSILMTPTERAEILKSGSVEIIGVPAACWLGVPLHMNGKVIGAFVVQSYDNPAAYTEKDMEVLEFASDQISLSISRKRTEHDLILAKEKAQESDRLKSTFLANMSHEIRTPMNAIVGFASLLTDPDLSAEEQHYFSGIIQSRSDDLMRIINDILEISRIESGSAPIVKGEVNLNSLIAETVTVTREKLIRSEKSHIMLYPETPTSADPLKFISDPYIIKQVFANLLDNAIKYTVEGEIRFGYHLPENGTITCYVTDTGIGISPGNQEIIFEHFRQAEIDNQHTFGGTGLGLAICKGSLSLLGGEIWVESATGKGSTFFFRIPFEAFPEMVHPAESKSVNQLTEIDYHWHGKRILIVEDEETNMEFLKIILKRTGAELICVYSARELRKHYSELGTISIVLLDVRLPDASGWDLVGEIKSQNPDLQVIAQTAYAMSTDRQRSEVAGCDNYISKPINKAMLLEMMATYLNLS